MQKGRSHLDKVPGVTPLIDADGSTAAETGGRRSDMMNCCRYSRGSMKPYYTTCR